jgi:N-acetylneuraminic acid mutarotase
MLATVFLLSAFVVTVDNVSAEVPEPVWEEAAPLPYPVYLAATVQDDDYHLYIIGGRVGVGTQAYDNVTLYDLETEEVSELAHMPVGVNGASAAIGEDGRIYVFGGRNLTLADLYQYEVQIYDPSTDSWSLGAGMPIPCTVSEAVAMPNGLIYVISGMNETVDLLEPLSVVQIYDPTENSWSAGSHMSEPRYSGASLAISDNVIMYIGGSNPAISLTYSDVTYYYVQEDQWWGSMNPFPEKFAGGDAVFGPDGMIYLVGGGITNSAYATSGFITDRSLCMDPYHSEYVYMPDLTIERKYHSVGVDEEGNIFAIGGFTNNSSPKATSTAEKIKVMDLQIQLFPQERDIFTGEQVLIKADFNFAFAPWDDLAALVEIANADGDLVFSNEATAFVGGGNPGHYYVDVPEVLPSGDYEVRLTDLHPADYAWDDLSFEGFASVLTFINAGSVQERLDSQNDTIGDLQDSNDALANDLADANEKTDSLSTNLMVVMVLAIIAIAVAAIAVVLLLRKKA